MNAETRTLPRDKSTKPIKNAIDEMLKFYNLDTKVKEAALINSWSKIAGNLIAKETSQIYVKEGKLYIKTRSSVVKQELSYHKTKLLQLITRDMGERIVDDIVI